MVRALAVMYRQRRDAFADVPTLADAAGHNWPLSAGRGLAGPAGLPDEGTTTLTAAFETVWNSAEFQDFMKGRGFGLEWRPGEEFASWMEESDASLGEVMQAVGLAK
jgi:tripartite-type tricarboxylate transporter receptor subunit TctC